MITSIHYISIERHRKRYARKFKVWVGLLKSHDTGQHNHVGHACVLGLDSLKALNLVREIRVALPFRLRWESDLRSVATAFVVWGGGEKSVGLSVLDKSKVDICEKHPQSILTGSPES